MAQINEATLAQLLSEHFEIDADQLRPNATFDELELDSLAVMELVVVIEEQTGLELVEEDLGLGPTSTLAEAAQALNRAVDEAHTDSNSAQGSALR
ncbi:acyl carrier protein [Streptomyces sp. CA-132043]|uniref:acyl carrier protein n=1 Tax=Streptomyces sp. CA-132043 TaxID=3240048 RepID=UPI003D9443BD